jgi:hypothetical protein
MELKLQKIGVVLMASIMSIFGVVALLNTTVVAQDTDLYDYDYGYDDYGYDYDYGYETTEMPAWFGILMMVCYCGMFIFLIANLVIWIMALIHCVQNAPEDKKTMWILLIVLVPFANWVYFFTKRKEWNKVATPVATA